MDAADRAFVEGDSAGMCDVRSESYVQTDTEFLLAEGKIVNSLEEAEALEAQRSATGTRLAGKDVQINKKQLCMMAYRQGRDFTRIEMKRTSIQIEVAPNGKSAVVKAHYSMLVPVFEQRATGVYDGARLQAHRHETDGDGRRVRRRGRRRRHPFPIDSQHYAVVPHSQETQRKDLTHAPSLTDGRHADRLFAAAAGVLGEEVGGSACVR